MRSLHNFMRFRIFLENLDRPALNEFIRAVDTWRQSRITGSQQTFTVDPRHAQAIQGAIGLAKQKIMDEINSRYRQIWPQYQQWETGATQAGLKWGLHPTSTGLGPAWKVGPLNLSNPQEAVIPQDFYNLLYWRDAIKGAESDLRHLTSGNQSAASSTAAWLRKLSSLIS